MDIQVKRGVLEACVLAALVKEDSYGYKLMHDVMEHIDISESTLYPILKRLEAANKLKVYTMEYNGRLRKYYSITSYGREELKRFVEDWKDVKEVFDFIKGELER